MRNIFLEKSYIKSSGEISPRLFSEKLKLSISLDQQSKDYYSLFLLYGKLRAIAIYQIKLQTTCFDLILNFFLKEEVCYQSPCLTFHIISEEKYFSCYVIVINKISLVALLCRILGNMYIRILCKPGCDFMNFEVNLIFLINLFLLHDQKVVNMVKTKRAFKMK